MKKNKIAFTMAEAMIVLGIIAVISTLCSVAVTKAKPDQSIVMFRRANSTLMKTLKDMANDKTLYPNFITISDSTVTTTKTCDLTLPTKPTTPSCTRISTAPTQPTAVSARSGWDTQVTRMSKVKPSTCTGDYGDAMSARGWFSSTSVSCNGLFYSTLCNFSSSLRSAVSSFNTLWENNNGCCTICGGTANYTLTGSNVASMFSAWDNVVSAYNSAISSYNSQVSNKSSSLWTAYNNNLACYNQWVEYDELYDAYSDELTVYNDTCSGSNLTSNSSVYFVKSASGAGFTDTGLDYSRMQDKLPYLKETAYNVSENNKFAVSFMVRLNPITFTVDTTNNKVTFTTADGIQWVIADKFNTTDQVAYITAVVTKPRDTDKGSCMYNSSSCKIPNKFIFRVEKTGKVTPVMTESLSAKIDTMACTYQRYPRINKQSEIDKAGKPCG